MAAVVLAPVVQGEAGTALSPVPEQVWGVAATSPCVSKSFSHQGLNPAHRHFAFRGCPTLTPRRAFCSIKVSPVSVLSPRALSHTHRHSPSCTNSSSLCP